jgi:transposase
MSRRSPFTIRLSTEERGALEQQSRRYTSPYWEVVRARVVLLAADGLGNDEIARRIDMPRQVVSKWRKRYLEEGRAGLTDRPRGGRPAAFPPGVVVEVKALACQLPAELGLPLARFSLGELRREAIRRASWRPSRVRPCGAG